MPINYETDTLINLTEASKLIPTTNGKRVHISTLWRWCMEGCKGVYLDHLRAGGRLVTTKRALFEFFEELTSQEHGAHGPSPRPHRPFTRTAKQRQNDINNAMKETAEAGIE